MPSKTLAPPPTTPASPPDCVGTVRRFFPGREDPYSPNEHISAPADVERCCVEGIRYDSPEHPNALPLEQRTVLMNQYRWRCCTAINEAQYPKLAIACTPWGPPVPPAFGFTSRRRRALLSSS